MKITIFHVIAAVGVTIIVEEIRANHLSKEYKRRFDDQNIRLAKLDELIEMIDPRNP